MMSTRMKALGLLLAAVLILGTACTPQASPSAAPTDAPTAAAATPAPADNTPAAAEPQGEPGKLTYWMELPGNNSSVVQNFAETNFAKALMEDLNLAITYQHPPSGQTREAFGVMVASGDLPDIIEYGWINNYPGGVTAAVQNNVIIKLNDYLQEKAPNFVEYLSENPDVDRQVKTDDGSYLVFPFIRGGRYLQTTSGPMLRADWIKDLGLDLPVTIADWEAVLTAFKEQKGATAPYTAQSNNDITGLFQVFMSAYKIRNAFFMDGKTVKYGPMEAGYKEFLTQMADWYKKGLIDQNFALTDRKTLDANILSGISGACYGPGGGGMGAWLKPGKEQDPNYDLVAVLAPVLKEGDVVEHFGGSWEFTQGSGSHAAITTKCADLDSAFKLLDYPFTEEGHLLFNFGREGVSYNMVDGKPIYSELVMNNPDGLSVAQAMSHNARGNASGPFVQDPGYIEQYYATEQQKNALVQWSAGGDYQSTLVPPISFTEAESSEYAAVFTDIATYVSEMSVKFVMGSESMDNYDKFIAQLESMGIARCIELQQAAVDRFYTR